MATLILLRHGQSEWNLENLFTGWVDVELTDRGEAEAVRGGELLAAEGVLPAVVHTSSGLACHTRTSPRSTHGTAPLMVFSMSRPAAPRTLRSLRTLRTLRSLRTQRSCGP